MIEVWFSNQQSLLSCDHQWLESCLQQVLAHHQKNNGELNIAIVDNQTIHQTNVEFLKHDYPTDVITFDLSDEGMDQEFLDGEIVVSAEMAMDIANQVGWSAQHELLLYLVHGILHLCGYDDHSDEDLAEMRHQEANAFKLLNLPIPPRS